MKGLIGTLVVLLVVVWAGPASAQVQDCIKAHFEPSENQSKLDWDPTEVKRVLNEIIFTYRLQTPVVVLPCGIISNAEAYVTDGRIPGVPAGNYIVYKDRWVNTVIGRDQHLAFALFAHELAHILNDDQGRLADGVPKPEVELQADVFAACAVARARGQFAAIEALLTKIRYHEDELYPRRDESLVAARLTFEKCQQTIIPGGKMGFHLGSIVVTPIHFFPAQDDAEALNEKVRSVLARAIRRLQSGLDTEHQQRDIGVVSDTVEADLNSPSQVREIGVAMGALAVVTGEGDLQGGNLEMSSEFIHVRDNPAENRPFLTPLIDDIISIRQDISAVRMSAQISPEWAHRAVVALAVEELNSAENGDPLGVERADQILRALLRTLTGNDPVLGEVKQLLTYIEARDEDQR